MNIVRQAKQILYSGLIGISCFLAGFSWGDTLARNIKKGNKLFDDGQYEEALRAYTEADVNSDANDPRLPQLYQNMGNTLYQQGSYDQAVAMYQKALEASDNGKFNADVHYNSGNTRLKQKDFQKALEAYTQALELNPKHQQARQNKAMVEKLIAQQQQQQQQCQNPENKDTKDQQQEQQSQEQNQEQQKEQQPPQQQDEQQTQEQEQQPQPAQEQPAGEDKEQQLSEEEALRILDALKEKEELLQQETPMPPRPVEKDW